MSDGAHLLIPFAASLAPGCVETLRALRLPHLQRLLARLVDAGLDNGTADSLTPPHERALARWRGWPVEDGLVPLAAWEACEFGLPGHRGAWACITPCHWRVGADHIALADPGDLELDEDSSRTMMGAVLPYFQQDGMALHFHSPLLWLAHGIMVAGIPTASIDRAIGRDIDPWMPRSEAARPLRRLQQEAQMLMYTLPANDWRQAQGLLPVNSFWISGTGDGACVTAERPGELRMPQALREAALRGDWHGWGEAWKELDATECAQLVTELDAGEAVRLTLCGERHARSWTTGRVGPLGRLVAILRPPAVAPVLEAL